MVFHVLDRVFGNNGKPEKLFADSRLPQLVKLNSNLYHSFFFNYSRLKKVSLKKRRKIWLGFIHAKLMEKLWVYSNESILKKI